MFCKYCGTAYKKYGGICRICGRQGADYNQNGYCSSKELYDIFRFLGADDEMLETDRFPEFTDIREETVNSSEEIIDYFREDPFADNNSVPKDYFESHDDCNDYDEYDDNEELEDEYDYENDYNQKSDNPHYENKYIKPIVVSAGICIVAACAVLIYTLALSCSKNKDENAAEPATEFTSYVSSSFVTAVPDTSVSESETTVTTTVPDGLGDSVEDFINQTHDSYNAAEWVDIYPALIDEENYGKNMENYIYNWADSGSGMTDIPISEYYAVKSKLINHTPSWLLYEKSSCGSMIDFNYQDMEKTSFEIGNNTYDMDYYYVYDTDGKQMCNNNNQYAYILPLNNNYDNNGYYMMFYNKDSLQLYYIDQNNDIHMVKYLINSNNYPVTMTAYSVSTTTTETETTLTAPEYENITTAVNKPEIKPTTKPAIKTTAKITTKAPTTTTTKIISDTDPPNEDEKNEDDTTPDNGDSPSDESDE